MGQTKSIAGIKRQSRPVSKKRHQTRVRDLQQKKEIKIWGIAMENGESQKKVKKLHPGRETSARKARREGVKRHKRRSQVIIFAKKGEGKGEETSISPQQPLAFQVKYEERG